MRAVSTRALAAVADHGWGTSTWSAAASAMLAYTALLRGETHQARTLSAQGLALGPVLSSAPLRFALRTVHGAASFDRGDRAAGWPSCSRRAPRSAACASGQSRPPRPPCSSSGRPCCSGTLSRPEPRRAG